jgi:hypothetical protein
MIKESYPKHKKGLLTYIMINNDATVFLMRKLRIPFIITTDNKPNIIPVYKLYNSLNPT